MHRQSAGIRITVRPLPVTTRGNVLLTRFRRISVRRVILTMCFNFQDCRVAAHVVGVFGREQFRRRRFLQTGKVVRRLDEKITVFDRTIRMRQENVSGETVCRA